VLGAIAVAELDGTMRASYIARRMMILAHTQRHMSTAKEAAAAAVYLRPGCDSSKRSPLFALNPVNGTEPGP
jgi:hypothetical protein